MEPEERPENLAGESGTQAQEQSPQEQQPAQPSASELRIQELLNENKELRTLANKIADNYTQQPQAQPQQREPEIPADQKQWLDFLGPKVQPLIDQATRPFRNGMMSLADQLDLTQTALEYPEYKDPSWQEEVERTRKQLQAQTGNLYSRKDIMIYLTGQKARDPKYIQERAKKMQEEQAAQSQQRNAAFVENSGPVGTRTVKTPKPLDDMNVEEMEKFMVENDIRG